LTAWVVGRAIDFARGESLSAWVVSNAHIDVLVNAAAEYGVLGEAQPQRLGQQLWHENVRSVNYRYGEPSKTPT
jgi:hypothetical protein